MVGVQPPWPDEGEPGESLTQPIETVLEADPKARLMLRVKLDPPTSWLNAHPDAAIHVDGAPQPVPCLASETWLQAAQTALEDLVQWIGERQYPVVGFVLECLENGWWCRTGGPDTSETNAQAFRRWVKSRYSEDSRLQQAWADTRVTLETVAIPLGADSPEPEGIFLVLPEERRYVDFRLFTAETTVQTIGTLAELLKRVAGPDTLVLAPYGYTFEWGQVGPAHAALVKLLESPVDGFVSPFSYRDSGVGGVGGVVGPVDTARAHGKMWFVMDETRTGITRDALTGRLNRLAGVSPQDVLSVQTRNFAAALAHGLGLFWTDAEGHGALLDPEIWHWFGKMRQIYEVRWGRLNTDEQAQRGRSREIEPERRVTLAVVVDETAPLYLRDAGKLGPLVSWGRDCALLTGVPVRFYLLNEVLDSHVSPASVYLFLNAWCLTEEKRNRLQEFLAEQTATAVWLYAPGYVNPAPPEQGGGQPFASPANIAATTGFQVKQFEEPTRSGSIYLLERAGLIEKGEQFGEAVEWPTLFYIEVEGEPETTVLANYRQTERPSAAIKFLEAGWASVYLAEPTLTPQMLRQILLILGEHIYVKPAAGVPPDVSYFGADLIALHSRDWAGGMRTVELTTACDIEDPLNERIGWPEKRVVSVSLRFGETRIFTLTPTGVETP